MEALTTSDGQTERKVIQTMCGHDTLQRIDLYLPSQLQAVAESSHDA